MASETLAKIYAAQHQYVAAAVIYEKLAARQPEQADELLERAAELRHAAPRERPPHSSGPVRASSPG